MTTLPVLTPEERRAAFARCRCGKATEADRIALAQAKGDRMLGPLEVERCSKHPRNRRTFRWTWRIPADGDHLAALEGDSDADLVRDCQKCCDETEAEIAAEDAAYEEG